MADKQQRGLYRDDEGQGLPGAGLGRAEDVPSAESVRQGGALDLAHLRETLLPQRILGHLRQRQLVKQRARAVLRVLPGSRRRLARSGGFRGRRGLGAWKGLGGFDPFVEEADLVGLLEAGLLRRAAALRAAHGARVYSSGKENGGEGSRRRAALVC